MALTTRWGMSPDPRKTISRDRPWHAIAFSSSLLISWSCRAEPITLLTNAPFHFLDGAFELGVFATGQRGEILRHMDVWLDTMSFGKPLALGTEQATGRHHDSAAIDQLVTDCRPDQATPGACSNERSASGSAEEPGKRVAA